jgi:chemotaxis protein methyltransferase CheR
MTFYPSPAGTMVRVNHEFGFSPDDFGRVRRMIAAYAGISLHERKENMVYNRLSRRLRATRIATFREYLDRVEADGSSEREQFVNALTTNLTAFFREPHHFELLAARARKSAERQRVWSSACSTGEEAYSAAIALREAGRSGEVLASDIDTDALATAREGVYGARAVEAADLERMRPHLLRGTGENANLVKVRPELRAMVKVVFHNLLAPERPAPERFDVVFCRNVMIYFDRSTQSRLLDRLAAALVPGGLLFLGHSENCASGHPAFQACGKTAYVRR